MSNKEAYDTTLKDIRELFTKALDIGSSLDKKPITVYNQVKFEIDMEMDYANLKSHRESGFEQ